MSDSKGIRADFTVEDFRLAVENDAKGTPDAYKIVKSWQGPLWDAVNAYMHACGGHWSKGGEARIKAVSALNRTLENLVSATLPAKTGGQSSLADVGDADIDTALERIDNLDDTIEDIANETIRSGISFQVTKLRTLLVKIRFPGVIKGANK